MNLGTEACAQEPEIWSLCSSTWEERVLVADGKNSGEKSKSGAVLRAPKEQSMENYGR
jgi:hypothetical protein